MFAPSLPPRMVVRRLLSDHATRLAQPHLRHAYYVIAKIKLTWLYHWRIAERRRLAFLGHALRWSIRPRPSEIMHEWLNPCHHKASSRSKHNRRLETNQRRSI